MNYRKALIRAFTFLGGVYFFLEFILPEKIGDFQFSKYNDQITTGLILIGVMAVGLGLINLLMVHGSKVVFKRRGWFESLVLLCGLFLMLAVTAADWYAGEQVAKRAGALNVLADFSRRIAEDAKAPDKTPAPVPPLGVRNQKLAEAALAELASKDIADDPRFTESAARARAALAKLPASGDDLSANLDAAKALSEVAALRREALSARYEQTRTRHLYKFLYDGLFVSLGSAMFALLGFYIASAAYRAFRVRSYESALMMVAAVLVMLGQIPFGIWLWSGFPAVRLWLLSVPNSAAFRAIELGASVAGVVLALRMWLSIESESFLKK